jgi:hypothetical protein
VGYDGFVGRAALNGDRGKQRGLEPAPELVGALKIDVGRPVGGVVFCQRGDMRGAGIEPSVESIDLFIKARRLSRSAGMKSFSGKSSEASSSYHALEPLSPKTEAVFSIVSGEHTGFTQVLQ